MCGCGVCVGVVYVWVWWNVGKTTTKNLKSEGEGGGAFKHHIRYPRILLPSLKICQFSCDN